MIRRGYTKMAMVMRTRKSEGVMPLKSNIDYYDPKTPPFNFGNNIFIKVSKFQSIQPEALWKNKRFVAIPSVCFRGP